MDRPDSPLDGEELAQMFEEAFPEEDRPRLLSILYEETQRGLPEKIAVLFFSHTLYYSDMTSKMHLNQLNCLVEFLQSGGGQRVIDFQTLAKDKLGDDWPLSDPAKEWKHIWRMIYMMLGFPGKPMHLYPTFSGMIEAFFERSESRDPTPIKFSLDDFMNVDLRIEPTDSPYEHLELSDGTVKILKESSSNLALLVSFSKNKVARALKMESLGDEIFSSYAALMINYKVDSKRYHVIMEPMNALKHAAFCGMLVHRKGDVKLLSQRVIALQREIDSRKRWWNSFTRDLSKQSDVQRLMFYGAVLAVLFGILTVIQTICSVWSVVLTYQTL